VAKQNRNNNKKKKKTQTKGSEKERRETNKEVSGRLPFFAEKVAWWE
jgi:hypothetical protein